jgi:hypothetical protein
VADGRPGDRDRVDRVALSERSLRLAGRGHHLWRHPDGLLAGLEQQQFQRAGEPAAVLKRPDSLTVELLAPGQQSFVPRACGWHGQRSKLDRGLAVHRRGGVGARVRVDADNDHRSSPWEWVVEIVGGQHSLGTVGHAHIRSHRQSPQRGGRHDGRQASSTSRQRGVGSTHRDEAYHGAARTRGTTWDELALLESAWSVSLLQGHHAGRLGERGAVRMLGRVGAQPRDPQLIARPDGRSQAARQASELSGALRTTRRFVAT